MKTSTQVVGTLVVLIAMFALTLVPMESTLRALTAALILAIGGGTMAFIRSRKSTRW